MITRTIVALLGYMCVAGFVANGQYCNSTSPCPSNQQCTMGSWGGSQCNWGTCGCASAGMKINSTTCVTPTVNVGGSCAFTSDCKGLYTMCSPTNNQCACVASTYTVNSDSSDCIPPAPPTKIPLNANCTITSTNMTCGTYAMCASNNTCQCLAGNYAPVGGSNNFDCTPQPANVAAGGTCSFTNGPYCVTGLSCSKCPESSTYTCQTAPTTTSTTTSSPGGGASNVRLDIMALVAALAFICFA